MRRGVKGGRESACSAGRYGGGQQDSGCVSIVSDTPGSTDERHGCGEAAGGTAHLRLGRSPGEEQ